MKALEGTKGVEGTDGTENLRGTKGHTKVYGCRRVKEP
jgi:hypothetical protein